MPKQEGPNVTILTPQCDSLRSNHARRACEGVGGERAVARNVRDFQRARVYAADAALFDWARLYGHHIEFVDLATAQAYVETVHAWTVEAWPSVRRTVPTVATRRGTRSKAIIEEWRIELANGRQAMHDVHFSNFRVLHELAHLYALPVGGHHAAFCSVYLQLVRKFVGATAAEFLLNQFGDRGVHYREAENAERDLPLPRQPNAIL
jgi:hypothetical protein